MNSFRVARAALRARPSAIRVPLQRRTYAEAVPDKARFSEPRAPATTGFCSIYKSQDVVQVNIPAESGEMGVLANHVPSIEQLKPGLVEVVEESAGSKQFFLSGGFATVQPNSVLSINAVEGYPLEDFSAEAIRAQIAEAQKVANGSGSEQDIAEAKIELEHVMIPPGVVGDRVRQLQTLTETQTARTRSGQWEQESHIERYTSETDILNSITERQSKVQCCFRPRTSDGRTTSNRPSQALCYSASTDMLPSESFMSSYLDSTNRSRTASSTEKCQDAMDILEQYGISRPSGWFSDGDADKIPELPTQSEYPENERSHAIRTTVDTARRRKLSRFASEPDTQRTSFRTKTQSRQRPKTDHNTLKSTRKKTIAAPTEISSSVKNNPFFVADRGMKKEAPDPEITTRSVQVERKPGPSDCVPNRLKSSSPRVCHIEEQCPDPGCRATHDGHYPTRHSIGCATRRSLGAQVIDGNDLDMIDTDEHNPKEKKHTQSLMDSPSRSKLQMKIDQLYHHGQDLHHSQHIMEHLSAGVQTLESSADERTTNGQNGRMRADGYRLRAQSQPDIDHSLSRDETVTVAKETIEHNLNKEPTVPDEIEPQPPNLTDYHKGDRHPSPKSHEPHDDTQPKDAHWINRPINNNKTHDALRDYKRTVNSQIASVKPVSQSKGPKKGLNISPEANERIAPQAPNKSLSEKGHDADLKSKKRIGKLDEPVLEEKMMPKPTPRINNDSERPKAEATGILS
ncbi:hypothetical protein F52700_3801 [Fusarium sp. NRRL 52700]|nr:hypothetical protein F52700_3801 [Fusarium sp. NRRL 52700]